MELKYLLRFFKNFLLLLHLVKKNNLRLFVDETLVSTAIYHKPLVYLVLQGILSSLSFIKNV